MTNQVIKNLQDMRIESCNKLAESILRARDITRHAALTKEMRGELVKSLGNAAPLLVEAQQFELIKGIAKLLNEIGFPAIITRATFKVSGYDIPDEAGLTSAERQAWERYIAGTSLAKIAPIIESKAAP